jgi:hypothetical protein
MKVSFLLLAICVSLGSVVSAGIDTETINKVVDARNASKDRNFVAFCARPGVITEGSAGHAFVIVGQSAEVGPTIITESWGFWPKKHSDPSTLFSFIVPVPGELAKEYTESKLPEGACRLAVFYDKGGSTEKALNGVISKWKKQNGYELGLNDCVTFTEDVAKALKLEVPDRATALTPARFIRELAHKNGKSVGGSGGLTIP